MAALTAIVAVSDVEGPRWNGRPRRAAFETRSDGWLLSLRIWETGTAAVLATSRDGDRSMIVAHDLDGTGRDVIREALGTRPLSGFAGLASLRLSRFDPRPEADVLVRAIAADLVLADPDMDFASVVVEWPAGKPVVRLSGRGDGEPEPVATEMATRLLADLGPAPRLVPSRTMPAMGSEWGLAPRPDDEDDGVSLDSSLEFASEIDGAMARLRLMASCSAARRSLGLEPGALVSPPGRRER